MKFRELIEKQGKMLPRAKSANNTFGTKFYNPGHGKFSLHMGSSKNLKEIKDLYVDMKSQGYNVEFMNRGSVVAVKLFEEPINENEINESSMKYQALSMAKEVHASLAELTFVEMLGVMDPSNPAKKEVQKLEESLNKLTEEVGQFVVKYMPDVANADAGDVDELPPEEENEEKTTKKEE